MGRRSGRFRKTTQDQTPSQLKGAHVVPPPAPAPKTSSTEQSVMRDIFAEAVNRPSRRGSMSSLNQQSSRANEILPADSEYDQAMSSNYVQDQNTKVGRTDSYRQAKNSSMTADDKRLNSYNSLPRLGKGAKHHPQQSQPRERGDPETRSLGEGAHNRQRRGGRKGDDNCQMM